jgi:AmiR/NasT family two-component response regulator
MRVWLVDKKHGGESSGLEARLRELQGRPGTTLHLLGTSPFHPDFAAAMAKLVPDLIDLIVINGAAWPDDAWSPEIQRLGVGMILVGGAERAERLSALAQTLALWFVPDDVSAEGLWLALLGAHSGQKRQAHFAEQVNRLQQRLNDRILIERAKAVLIQRLHLSEEDAYRRLRVQSRRQRRPLRDIAQSLIDSQFLLLPNGDDFLSAGHDPTDKDEDADLPDPGLVAPGPS